MVKIDQGSSIKAANVTLDAEGTSAGGIVQGLLANGNEQRNAAQRIP